MPPPEDCLPPCARWSQDGGSLVLELSGDWEKEGPPVKWEGEMTDQAPNRYDCGTLRRFDSTLPAFLLARLRESGKVESPRSAQGKPAGSLPPLEGLPPNLRGLMELALAVPEDMGTKAQSPPASDLKKLGKLSLKVWASLLSVAEFTGQSVLAMGRLVTGRAHFRARDFWMVLQECGPSALPIVTLISFLIGLILAFVGNVQLASFGASLYVADLVGIAMVREMGVVMTAIIMSGRTGAAFAAHLGSMKANEEIDALKTFGFDPFDFLVLPRMLALILMMPLLTIYANLVGILGGMLVGASVGIPPVLYWNETLSAVNPTNASLGVIKSIFFGAAIALSGCLQGLHAGNSSAAVGQATTRAVVAAITSVIILDSAFAAIFTVLGI